MSSVSNEDSVVVTPPPGVTGTEISIDHVVYKGNAADGFSIPARHVHRLLALGWVLKSPVDFSELIAKIDALTAKIKKIIADMEGDR